MAKKAYKIVVTGPYAAGKSTLVRSLCKDSLSIDSQGTTVVMDYGMRRYQEMDIALFGTPGQQRFNFMIEIISKDADGIILVIDSAYPETWPYAMIILKEVIKAGNIPCVVCANKQDLPNAQPSQVVMGTLGTENPVIETVALTGKNVEVALETLMKIIEETGKKPSPITPPGFVSKIKKDVENKEESKEE